MLCTAALTMWGRVEAQVAALRSLRALVDDVLLGAAELIDRATDLGVIGRDPRHDPRRRLRVLQPPDPGGAA